MKRVRQGERCVLAAGSALVASRRAFVCARASTVDTARGLCVPADDMVQEAMTVSSSDAVLADVGVPLSTPLVAAPAEAASQRADSEISGAPVIVAASGAAVAPEAVSLLDEGRAAQWCAMATFAPVDGPSSSAP